MILHMAMEWVLRLNLLADETNCIGVHISADGWYMCISWHQSLDSGESRIDPIIISGCTWYYYMKIKAISS